MAADRPGIRARRALAGVVLASAIIPFVAGGAADDVSVAPGTRLQAQASSPGGQKREEAYRRNNIGVAHLEQYDYDKAVGAFREALALAPDLAMARTNLAIALLYQTNVAEARAEAEVASRQLPSDPRPHYVLGLVARAENRAEDAVRALGRVLELDPHDLGARVNLGQVYLQQRRYGEAAELFRTAFESEPYNVTAAYNLGVALTRSGRADEGRRMFERAQQLRDSGYGTTFSNIYLEQGKYAEALVSTGAERELVDRDPPEVVFERVVLREVQAAAARGRQALVPAQVFLADLDRDGDLDVLTSSDAAILLLANEGGTFAAPRPLGDLKGGTSVMLAADYDNDLLPDVFAAGPGGVALLKQGSDGRFTDASRAAGLPTLSAPPHAAAFVDVDHDGDADLFLSGGQPQALLLRNNGNGTFSDITAAAGLAGAGGLGVVPTDYDNRRDVDLLVVAGGTRPALYRNRRDGSFEDVARTAGLPDTPSVHAVAAGDVNKDGFPDFFFARADGPGVFALSDGRGGFVSAAAPDLTQGASHALLADYDNDGLLDLVLASADGIRLVRGLGDAWEDQTRRSMPDGWRPGTLERAVDAPRLLAGDIDADGDVDLVVGFPSGAVEMARNNGGSRHRSVSVRLTGRVSNRSGLGAKVEIRAGSLRSRAEFVAAVPAPVPSDLTFGLGSRPSAEVARILWPAGVLQAETIAPSSGDVPVVLDVTELDRKPSSCPFLYTWNGDRFVFVTDFLGGGEMGAWLAPGVRSTPDPDEYVRITSDQLRPRGNRYELRVTNELEETLFLDRIQLLAVTHAAGLEVHANEGLVSGSRRPFALYAAPDLQPPLAATDHRGRDVLARLVAEDRQVVDDLPVEAIRGYARPHTLTLDLGRTHETRGGRVLLLLTGWTDYAFSSDNVAASQAGLALDPPLLQVRNGQGEWTTVVEDIGFPVGRPQTVVVELTGKFLSASREVRIVTSMRIYWDRILVDASGSAEVFEGVAPDGFDAHSTDGPALARLDLLEATLRWRGFSAEVRPDGREPVLYDYARVSPEVPWKLMPGRYTREGDVSELVAAADDMFVVSRPGDEIALSFDAAGLPDLPPGMTRTFFLFAEGYSKEMDFSSSSPDQAAPLPFRGMTAYPYAFPEAYPSTPAHRAYVNRYNTRVVGKTLPPLELAGLARSPLAPPRASRPTVQHVDSGER